jgi:hypothetical protein
MKDKRGIVLISCYLTGLVLALLIIFLPDIPGDYLKAGGITVVTVWLIIIIISIVEVIRSDRIGVWEKVIWIIGIMSVLNLAGLVYIILRRWRIIEFKKQSHA